MDDEQSSSKAEWLGYHTSDKLALKISDAVKELGGARAQTAPKEFD